MKNLEVGSKVIFRNGETCTVKKIIVNDKEIVTCDASFKTNTFKAGESETIILEFDDGEITIANRSEFELI